MSPGSRTFPHRHLLSIADLEPAAAQRLCADYQQRKLFCQVKKPEEIVSPFGAFFIGGQVYEYVNLINEGTTISSGPYGSVFFLTTGFHGMHVTGGLFAFLLVLGRTYITRRFTHEQATSAIVVSYYWHFVDVVWIGLFSTIYLIQ